METPTTRFADTDDGLRLAYQDLGEGAPLVWVPGLIGNVELAWEHELYRRVAVHVSRHLRLVHFDKRGIGNSDRFEGPVTLDQRLDDVLAVMRAAGIERAHIGGMSEGGLIAAHFAARHPERVDRLVIANAAPGLELTVTTYTRDEIDEIMSFFTTDMIDEWGRPSMRTVEHFFRSHATDPSFVEWFARLCRFTGGAADIRRQVDALASLPSPRWEDIAAPTLVIGTTDDPLTPAKSARAIAGQIDGADYQEFEGVDHYFFLSPTWRGPVDAALKFVLDRPLDQTSARVFATVLFTDIVESTDRASAAGDAAWRDAVESHDRVARTIVEEEGGTWVKSTGDGLLAHFPTPSAAVDAASRLRTGLNAIGLPIRAGVHAGEIQLHSDGDVSGIAVNLAARVEGAAAAGEVWVSGTVRDLLLGSGHTFVDRGDHVLKGIEGSWRLFALTPAGTTATPLRTSGP